MEFTKLTTLKEVLSSAKKNYTDIFNQIGPCNFKSNRKNKKWVENGGKHDWMVSEDARPGDLRYPDIVCKKCESDLGTKLKLFVGFPDVG
jgi:hypothetical protein